MEITQDNFQENLKFIEDSIDQADFISIDLEFSGYTAGPDDKEHEYDSVEERYQKIRSVINKFVAFQIGICCFKFDDSTNKYLYRPFNFYVWPKSKIQDQSMMFNSGAVSFLISNNFDFNKLFSKGINYGRYTDLDNIVESCRQKVVNKNLDSQRSCSQLSKTHQEELENMLDAVRDFAFDPTAEEKITFTIQSYSLKKALSRKITEQYMSTGIFTEFTRQSPETIVKKTKQFKQFQFLKQNSQISVSENGKTSTCFIESKISGKNTAVTVIDPVFGFCDQEDAEQEAEPPKLPEKIEDPKKDEKAAEIAQAEIDEKVNKLVQFEIGFSHVVKKLSEAKKPIVGHNCKFDLAFLYHQFYKQMPKTFSEFASSLNSELFPVCYDTKVICQHAGRMAKSDLQYLYNCVTQNKKYNNNIFVDPDTIHPAFSTYKSNGGQGHDAGYDSYMTGVIFVTLAKFIEIGNIVNKTPKVIDQLNRAQKREELEKQGLPNNKRNRKMLDKVDEPETKPNARKIKHFSAVQNKPVYYPDISQYKNRIMMNINEPTYFYLDSNLEQTKPEISRQSVINNNVVYLKLKENLQENQKIGKRPKYANVFQLSEMFNKFGDINIVKDTQNSCYIEFQDIDADIVSLPDEPIQMTSMKLGLTDQDEEEHRLPVAQEIIKMIKKEMGNKKQKNIFNEHIEYVSEYKDSIKFQYNGNNFEGGLS